MGPLAGVRIIEIAGIGPAPFTAMMLGDMGADVIRIDRSAAVPADPTGPTPEIYNRSRRSVGVDLKHDAGPELVLRLLEGADGLIEGFRPGVAERLGIGPDEALARNPRLVYGRMTGWGQDGPLSLAAGHDINYIGLAGALHPIGRGGQPPVPPLNLVGDFGGGGMLLAFGMVCGIIEARTSGRGQVVDAAMVDGSALLTTMIHAFRAMGVWSEERSANLLDTGAPFYDVYETADGEYVALGALEPQFYAELITKLGLTDVDLSAQNSRSGWPAMRERLTATFKTRTREEWVALLEGTDACFAPVLSLAEAPRHPHNQARGTFVELAGITQPAPAPRFSRTAGEATPPPRAGRDTEAVLAEAGFSAQEIGSLRESGAIR